jgi:uncharacterized DUF497 family protein
MLFSLRVEILAFRLLPTLCSFTNTIRRNETEMNFEWHDLKAEANLQKHGVSFQEAVSVFYDPRSRTVFDEKHSQNEDRFFTLGVSNRGRLVVVWHTDRDDAIRIIGARKPNKHEISGYPND